MNLYMHDHHILLLNRKLTPQNIGYIIKWTKENDFTFPCLIECEHYIDNINEYE